MYWYIKNNKCLVFARPLGHSKGGLVLRQWYLTYTCNYNWVVKFNVYLKTIGSITIKKDEFYHFIFGAIVLMCRYKSKTSGFATFFLLLVVNYFNFHYFLIFISLTFIFLIKAMINSKNENFFISIDLKVDLKSTCFKTIEIKKAVSTKSI